MRDVMNDLGGKKQGLLLIAALVLGLAVVLGLAIWKTRGATPVQEPVTSSEQESVEEVRVPTRAEAEALRAPQPDVQEAPAVDSVTEDVPVQEETVVQEPSAPAESSVVAPQEEALIDIPKAEPVPVAPTLPEATEPVVTEETAPSEALAPGDLVSEESRDAFAQVSQMIFARNEAYNAAIARAQSENNLEVVEALRLEMAQQARGIVETNFPGGVADYRRVADLIRQDASLERDIAQRLLR